MLGLSLRGYLRLVDEEFPGNVAPYWTRLIERPAYKRAIAAETEASG
jgi:hypothetical protein